MARQGYRLASALERLLQRGMLLRLRGTDDLDERSHQVLAGLSRLGPTSAAALGTELGIDRSRVSRLADKLVAAGFVAREADATDARATLLTLTGSGEREVAQRRTALARRLDVLTAAWPNGLDAAFADGADRLIADLAPDHRQPRSDTRVADDSLLSPAERHLFRSVLAITDTTRSRVTGEIRPITGLTTADFLVLSRLHEFPGDTYSGLKALAAKLEWTASRLSHQLTRMESRGLVTRGQDVATGQVRITATSDAAQLLAKHTGLHARAVRQHLLANITEDEAAVFVRVAERMARSAATG